MPLCHTHKSNVTAPSTSTYSLQFYLYSDATYHCLFFPLNVFTEWGLGVLLEVNLLLKTKDHLPVRAAAEVVIQVLLSVFPSACCYLLRITPGEQVTLLKMTWSHEESEVSQIFTVGIPTWKMQINLSNLSIIGFLFVLQWYKHLRCWIFVCF